jgi:hypothetical protein
MAKIDPAILDQQIEPSLSLQSSRESTFITLLTPPSFSRFLPLINGESGIHNRPTKEELKKNTHPRLTETAAGSYVPHLQT